MKKNKTFEEKIGSDFRLFLNNFSFQKSLRKVIKNKNKFKCYFIIVFPFIYCKTKKYIQMVKNFSKSFSKFYLKKQKSIRFN